MQHRMDLIWKDFHKELEGFINSRVKDGDMTKDIFQDIFIKIQSNIGTLKDESKLSSWIYQITRNAINDHFRKLKHHLEINEYDPAEQNQILDNTDLQKCLKPFINQLEHKYKEALTLTEFEGLTQRQLAQKLTSPIQGQNPGFSGERNI